MDIVLKWMKRNWLVLAVLALLVALTMLVVGCGQPSQLVMERSAEARVAVQEGQGKAQETKSQAQTTEKLAVVSVKQAKDIDAQTPVSSPLKPLVQEHVATVTELADSAQATTGTATEAVTKSKTAVKTVEDLSDTVVDLSKEIEEARSGHSFWIQLIGYGCLALGITCGVGYLYLRNGTPKWLSDTLLAPVKAGLIALSLGLTGTYLVMTFEDELKTILIVAGIAVALGLVAKLLFYRRSLVGVATAVKDQNAVAVAEAANPITPTGLGAWLGKLKLLVQKAPESDS